MVEIIEDTIMKLVEYVKGSKIDLIFDTNEEEVYLYLDRDFMERIILNLISNALKYTPRNGKILVEVEDSEKSVVIKVEDNGVGMEEEFVNSAFTRYARGKNNEYVREKGTGIGLFVVKNLMELQNGGIEIKSKVGKGTSIFLSFNKELKENEHI
ncbi:Alkaline phosphatase synthesis sensor protein PhoR [compost metagenome]